MFWQLHLYIGGSKGGRAPQGSRFFRFDIQNFRNVTASGVHAPLRGPRPPTGNPGMGTAVIRNTYDMYGGHLFYAVTCETASSIQLEKLILKFSVCTELLTLRLSKQAQNDST